MLELLSGDRMLVRNLFYFSKNCNILEYLIYCEVGRFSGQVS